MVHSTNVLAHGLRTNDRKKRRFSEAHSFTIVKITSSTDKEICKKIRLLARKANGLEFVCSIVRTFDRYKPRGASPLGQFLLVGPLFLCVEKVRGRK